MASKSATPPALPVKRAIVFSFEDVLVPGPGNPNVDVKKTKAVLKKAVAYAKKKDLNIYIISSYQEALLHEKLSQSGLEGLLPDDHVFGVHSAYLSKMEPLDRERYDARCKDDPACTDEYYRQVEMQAIMEKEKLTPEQMLLVGHDYWFDGFYTRRYAKVDIAFIESGLTNRNGPISERIEGLWYAPFEWKALQKLVEGKTLAANYARLDAWTQSVLTEALLGGKGVTAIRKVIIERKKNDSGGDVLKIS